MQTAKTLDKGELQTSAGMSGYAIDYADEVAIAPDFLLRVGLNEKSDIGIGYSVGYAGHLKADYKRELWNSADSSKYVSTGLGFDLWHDADGPETNIALTLPFYFSMNHSKKVIPYFAQRFTFGLYDTKALSLYNNDNSGANSYDLDHIMYYSGAAGLRFGEKKVKWFTEASYSTTIEHFYRNRLIQDPSEPNARVWQSERRKRESINLQFTIGVMFGLR